MLQKGDPPTTQDVDLFAARYGLAIPLAWRLWSRRNGWQRQVDGGWELLGLTPAPSGLDVAAMLAGIRFTVPGFPAKLVPIEWLPERQLACMRLDGTNDPQVVIVDLDDPQTWDDTQPVVDRFSLYADEFTRQAHALRRIAKFLAHQQDLVLAGRRAADQAPRPDDWRVYRFCSQNVVIALVLLRFDRDRNALSVGDCLITQLSRLDPDAPARAVCTLLLAEAHRSGGNLSIRFVTGSGRITAAAPIPRAISQWAGRCGIALDSADGVIPADAALRLFVASVRVSDQLRERIGALPPAAAAAVCHGIASGVWPSAAVEAILTWSHRPTVVLKGATDPLDRAWHTVDLLDAREGLLIAAAVHRIAAGTGDTQLDAEDTQLPVDLVVHADRTCTASAETIDLTDWLVCGASTFPASVLRLTVADAELDQLPDAVLAAVPRLFGGGAVLCPRDLRSLDGAVLDALDREARRAGVMLLAGPQYTPSLTMRAADTLARARTARQ
nr:hypothetical protein GCM10020063_010390 [Dactylosporangium thailandense]